MRPPDTADYWVAKAKEDEHVADLVIGSGFALSMGAYHLQQSIEKRLKGLLVLRGTRPPKTHDLIELASLMYDIHFDDSVKDALFALSALAWTTRYPGADEIDSDRMETIRSQYSTIRKWLDDAVAENGR